MDTLHLVEQCRLGDALAIEALVSAHQANIYRLALSILNDPYEADEATQDTFIAALDGLESYRAESNLRTWLYAIAINECRGRLRKRGSLNGLLNRLWRSLLKQPSRAVVGPEELMIERQAAETLYQAVHHLEENLRLPIILRYAHELPVSEIAQVLNISRRSVHSRLKKAHIRLQSVMVRESDPE